MTPPFPPSRLARARRLLWLFALFLAATFISSTHAMTLEPTLDRIEPRS